MAGVARDYCMGIAEGKQYQALLTALSAVDEEAVAKRLADLDDLILGFAVSEFKRINGHNLRTDKRTRKRADKLEDPDKMGPVARAFYEKFEKPFGLDRPKSYASERQFFEGLQRQTENLLPEWYTRTQSELKTLDFSQIK